MLQITPHNLRLQVAQVTIEYRRVASEWRREHDVIFIRSNPAFDDKAITRALFCIANTGTAIQKCCCTAFA